MLKLIQKVPKILLFFLNHAVGKIAKKLTDFWKILLVLLLMFLSGSVERYWLRSWCVWKIRIRTMGCDAIPSSSYRSGLRKQHFRLKSFLFVDLAYGHYYWNHFLNHPSGEGENGLMMIARNDWLRIRALGISNRIVFMREISMISINTYSVSSWGPFLRDPLIRFLPFCRWGLARSGIGAMVGMCGLPHADRVNTARPEVADVCSVVGGIPCWWKWSKCLAWRQSDCW